MKTTKRFLSIVLMLAMLVSMFTVMAFADGEIRTTIILPNDGDVYLKKNGENESAKQTANFQIHENDVVSATKNGYEAEFYYMLLGVKKVIIESTNGQFTVGKNLAESGAFIYVQFNEKQQQTTKYTVTVHINGTGKVMNGNTEIKNRGTIELTADEAKTLTTNASAGTTVCWNLNDSTISYDSSFTLKNISKNSDLYVTFVSMDPVPDPKPNPDDPDTLPKMLTVRADDSSEGYIKCGTEKKSSITKTLYEFEKYTFEAVAKDGYRFVEWQVSKTGDATVDDKTSATTTITMGKKDTTVTAVFERDDYYGDDVLYIDITNPSRGTVKFLSDKNVADGKDFWLEDGKTYTIYATADRGYTAYWYYNGTRDYGRSFTFEMDDRCDTLHVEFVKDGCRPDYDDDSHTLTIDITGEKHGTVKRGTTKIYDGYTMSLDKNDTRTFKATPDKGYVAVWTFRGESYVGNEFTVKMGSKNATLYIEFMDEDDYRLWNLPFRDVSERDWFYADVAYVYANGYMEGISSTKFAPNQNTTRAQIVTILWRLTGEPRAMRSNKFNDVSSSAYYDQAVSWAVEAGVVNGFDAKTFKPNDYVTREQLAAILYRYAEYMNLSTRGASNLSNYNDYYKIGSWARDAMAWANYHGLINGVSYSRIDPKGYATRAQIAAILHRFAVEFGNY